MIFIIYGVYTFLAAYNAGNMLTLQIQHYGIYTFVSKENFKSHGGKQQSRSSPVNSTRPFNANLKYRFTFFPPRFYDIP